jgi:hypothetical protein
MSGRVTCSTGGGSIPEMPILEVPRAARDARCLGYSGSLRMFMAPGSEQVLHRGQGHGASVLLLGLRASVAAVGPSNCRNCQHA